MLRALVTPHLLFNQPGTYRDLLEAAGFEVVYPPAGFDIYNAANLPGLLADCDAVLASTEPLSRAVLAQTPRLRVIA